MTTTIPETICEYLSDKILSGKISPGQKIEEALITKKFNVSRTPVREAIRLLSATGLVKIEPRRGATVVALNIEQLTDMFEALVEIEALCAQFCAQRISTFEKKSLEDILQRFESAISAKDEILYSALNEEFHKFIYQCSHNQSLQNTALNLWQQLAPYRRNIFFTQKNRMLISHAEHKEISKALMDSDKEQAFSTMHNHVTNSSINAIEYLRNTRT